MLPACLPVDPVPLNGLPFCSQWERTHLVLQGLDVCVGKAQGGAPASQRRRGGWKGGKICMRGYWEERGGDLGCKVNKYI